MNVDIALKVNTLKLGLCSLLLWEKDGESMLSTQLALFKCLTEQKLCLICVILFQPADIYSSECLWVCELSVEPLGSPHLFKCIRTSFVYLHVIFTVVESGKKTSLWWRGSRRKRSHPRLMINPPQRPAPLPATPPPLIPHSPKDKPRRTRARPRPKGSSHQPCDFWQCSNGVWQSACSGFATYWRKAKGQGWHASSINIKINREQHWLLFLSAYVPEVFSPFLFSIGISKNLLTLSSKPWPKPIISKINHNIKIFDLKKKKQTTCPVKHCECYNLK